MYYSEGSGVIVEYSNGKFYLVRHAEAQENYSGHYKILPGPPLSTSGVRKAEALKEFFKNIKIDKIICSPFERAYQTASIIANEKIVPETCNAWSEEGPIEPYAEVEGRVKNWLLNNLPFDDHTYVIVAHGATLNAALFLINQGVSERADKDPDGCIMEKAGVWLISWKDGKILSFSPVQVCKI